MILIVTLALVGVILVATIIGTTVIQQRRLLRIHHSLSGRLIAARDTERAALARELHDDIVSRLDSISRGLRELAGSDSTDFGDEVAVLADELRDMSRQLHPALLDLRGLDSALHTLGDASAARAGIVVPVQLFGNTNLLPRPVQLTLFRIAQEALGNAIKHAAATKVDVVLHCTERQAELVIQDDGDGFEHDEAGKGQGLGLLSMAERARFLGGELSVHSTITVGTKVCASIPLHGS